MHGFLLFYVSWEAASFRAQGHGGSHDMTDGAHHQAAPVPTTRRQLKPPARRTLLDAPPRRRFPHTVSVSLS